MEERETENVWSVHLWFLLYLFLNDFIFVVFIITTGNSCSWAGSGSENETSDGYTHDMGWHGMEWLSAIVGCWLLAYWRTGCLVVCLNNLLIRKCWINKVVIYRHLSPTAKTSTRTYTHRQYPSSVPWRWDFGYIVRLFAQWGKWRRKKLCYFCILYSLFLYPKSSKSKTSYE